MKARMRLGDLLIQAKLVTAAQVAKALELQAEVGGRLGERLVGIEAITREVLAPLSIACPPSRPILRQLESTRQNFSA
jgi:hypothetical protein